LNGSLMRSVLWSLGLGVRDSSVGPCGPVGA
jgi:hypothetical protein